jgi:hydroxyacylglutathione hydrolase
VNITTFSVGPLGCNCSIVADPRTQKAVVVDPGGDFDRIRALLDAEGLQVVSIVHTHTHIDHVGATAPLSAWSGASPLIHEADRFLYRMLPVQAVLLGVPVPETCDVEGSLTDGFSLHAGNLELGVIHTPGHTPGSVSFVLNADEGRVLFTGDTLFRRGIGRTDLWGGDSEEIMRSLRHRLLPFGDDTIVIPGHGPETSIGDERRENPFLAR